MTETYHIVINHTDGTIHRRTKSSLLAVITLLAHKLNGEDERIIYETIHYKAK